jgi:hypothetical protein
MGWRGGRGSQDDSEEGSEEGEVITLLRRGRGSEEN